MKKLMYLIVAIVVLAIIVVGCTTSVAPPVDKAKPDNPGNSNNGCVTIQDGILETSDGNLITTGYDEWGYNYQAHMFNGGYCDAYRDAAWCQEWKDDYLIMKWNDAWLSNKDCGTQNTQAEFTNLFAPDGLLDRHYPYDSYIGSGAWCTNHQSGNYNVWDLTGDWVLELYLTEPTRTYVHDMTITDDSCGSFSGTGAYPSGGTYTITWIVTGVVTGDDVVMIIDYDESDYMVKIDGTIAEDGTMSGDWTSNAGHIGTWESTKGNATSVNYKWNYFVKIVAAPADAYVDGGIWYNADGTEIGPVIWGAFAIIQEVYNDQCTGEHGIYYLSPVGPGLGKWESGIPEEE